MFNNKRRENKLDKSLSSEFIGQVETFERNDTQGIKDSPNDYLKNSAPKSQLILKHHYMRDSNRSLD